MNTANTVHKRTAAVARGVAGATVAACSAGLWLLWLTRATALPAGMDTAGAAYFIGGLAFAAVGWLLAVHRPTNAVGWLLLAAGLAWGVHGLSGVYRVAALIQRSDLPGGVWAAWAWDWTWVPAVLAVFLLPLLFPDGQVPSRRWRLVVAALACGAALIAVAGALRPGPLPNTPFLVNPAAIPGAGRLLDGVGMVGNFAFMLAGVAALAAPVVRYRRVRGVERQQLKWFAYAGAVVLSAWLAANGLEAAGTDPALLANLRLVPLLLLPVAVAFAVLQHRLGDIDVVINKSLVYGALALFIGGMYVVVVVGVGSIFGGRGPADVPLSITATALTAVAFAPVRARLQVLADRLVYGDRASPYEVLAAFTSRMTGATPGGDMLAEMARAVAEAVGARAGEVWLRAGPQLRRSARWPDAAGQASVPVPDNGDGSLQLPGVDYAYPVRRRGRLLGALAVATVRGHRISPADDALLVDLASAAWLLLDNAALIDEVHASRQRLVTAQDAERVRIERDLHDGAQQRLLELALTLRLARDEAAAVGAHTAAATVDAAQGQLRAALAELREFARGIHPAILTTQGLGHALESLAERAPLPVTVTQHWTGRLPPPVEATAYFVASEALANVIKHASASHVTVEATLCADRLKLTITDDGVGGAEPGAPGLQGLADRVAALDGSLDVVSPAGQGTRVEVVLPCA